MAVVASAPGKVLITGGYLILERPNAGIVLSTNARFYAIVKPLHEEIKPDSWAWIESCGLPLTPEALATLPPFTSITFNIDYSNGGNCKPEVAKTGLGSSAAMTTAVVAALLYLGVVDLSSLSEEKCKETNDSQDLDLVHIIAQIAHCIAQGKVGSGFDVSSAVYGSQRYVRFSPEVLSTAQNAAKVLPLQDFILDIIKGKWDHERKKFSLLPLMTLLLGEPGTGGSSTPSMVGSVKKWQKSDPQKSYDMWRKLSEANFALETQLSLLSRLAEECWDVYKHVISSCSRLRSEKWVEEAKEPNQEAIIKALLGARGAMLNIRNYMRQMGEAAGIPIEPNSQTQLLDATMNMEGVLLAGVPGAGGFDAIFTVALGDSSCNITKIWSSVNVLALLVREDPYGVSLESGDPRIQEASSAISSVHIE